MRLICPNCSAQYEIDVTLIPDEGRDVQCSNCGHTWFELPPAPPSFADAPEPEEVEERPSVEEPLAEPEPDDEPEHDSVEQPAEAVEPEPELESAAEQIDDDETPDGADVEQDDVADESDSSDSEGAQDAPSEESQEQSTAARAIAEAAENIETEPPEVDPFAAAAAVGASLQQKRRPTDEAALNILREEAEREVTQRRAMPTNIETQTDMSLETVTARSTPSRALRARMARDDSASKTDRSSEPIQDPRIQSVDDGYEAPRRDLLPDIDEINSSLKSRRGKDAEGSEAVAVQRKGFRSGFFTMVLIAALLILAYAFAPAIARAVPSLESPLLSYVDGANGVRDWIDGLIAR